MPIDRREIVCGSLQPRYEGVDPLLGGQPTNTNCQRQHSTRIHFALQLIDHARPVDIIKPQLAYYKATTSYRLFAPIGVEGLMVLNTVSSHKQGNGKAQSRRVCQNNSRLEYKRTNLFAQRVHHCEAGREHTPYSIEEHLQ